MRFRSLVLITHRWVGLSTSMVLAITGSTGAILVWPGSSLVRRIAGRLHDTLALGSVGAWIVLIATAAAVVLQSGGLILWWRRKRIAIRRGAGWNATLIDLHHSAGVLALLLMFTLASSALAMRALRPPRAPVLARAAAEIHTGRSFPFPLRVLYTLGSAAFLIQGITGLAMWWNAGRRLA